MTSGATVPGGVFPCEALQVPCLHGVQRRYE